MDWHGLSEKEILSKLDSNIEKGLSSKEAANRLKKYGKNKIESEKKKTKIQMFLDQFKSLLVIILIIAAVISIAIGHLLDGVVIGVIIVINAAIGFVQEYKAENIIEKLKKSLQYEVIVLRDGKRIRIKPENLVPGDVVVLNEGDKILADYRIIEKNNLQVNEAVLTGESFPVSKSSLKISKNVELADRKNMLFAGTSIVLGNCKAIVVETGKNTEFGKIAELVKSTQDDKMPLEEKLDSFSKKLSVAIIGLIAIAFFIGLASGIEIFEMFLTSVSLAVATIPEGLPAIIVITLAVAIKRMYESKTLIRKLPAAETLGRATVICTDKTGTLTEEGLTVDEIYAGKNYHVEEMKKLNEKIKSVLEIGLLCNNARDETDDILGDPTEVALIKVAKKFEILKKEVLDGRQRLREFPFTSERKMMSIIREVGRKKISYVKGAPSVILARCTKEIVNGREKMIGSTRRKELQKIHEYMASRGLRVLGFAYKQVTKINQKEAEDNLVFVGYQGMIDPPRKEVKEAMREAMAAGIKIKIITGDSALTTKNVAERLGLRGEIIEGKDLEKLEEKDWIRIVREKTIFARTTPSQKLKIVETLEELDETVAVTGDGVNDVLALKKADIGVSMGVRGSDVARDSSDMVLMDDNFASIIMAVKEGRRVFDNLKKSIKFLLSANAGELLVVMTSLVLGFPLPFLPLAILWMNLVTDSLPALALAVEPAESDVMRRKPRKEGVFSGTWQWIVIAGILATVSSVSVFFYALENFGLDVARTMAITTIIFFQMFFVFSCKSHDSLFRTGVMDNKWLIYAVGASIGLHLLAIYSPLGVLFGFISLSFNQLIFSILAGFSGLIFFEVWKIFKELKRK